MSNYCKYYKQKKQVSYDGGSTWQDTSEYRKGELYEYESLDCEYIPPTFEGKWISKSNTGRISSAACDSSSSINTKEVDYNYRTSITAVTVGNCVTQLGKDCFCWYTALKIAYVPSSVTSVGMFAFGYCYDLTEANFDWRPTTIPYSCFGECSGLTSVTIPDSVEIIDEWAFSSCINLTGVSIPNSVRRISDEAFDYCTSMTSVTIGNGVTTIGLRAFRFINASTLTIPDSVTSISGEAFCNNSSLTSLTIGSGVTSICYQAFALCTNLTGITITAIAPPTLVPPPSSVMKGPFYETNNCPIYVPASSVEAYKTANRWTTYASRIYPIP